MDLDGSPLAVQPCSVFEDGQYDDDSLRISLAINQNFSGNRFVVFHLEPQKKAKAPSFERALVFSNLGSLLVDVVQESIVDEEDIRTNPDGDSCPSSLDA